MWFVNLIWRAIKRMRERDKFLLVLSRNFPFFSSLPLSNAYFIVWLSGVIKQQWMNEWDDIKTRERKRERESEKKVRNLNFVNDAKMPRRKWWEIYLIEWKRRGSGMNVRLEFSKFCWKLFILSGIPLLSEWERENIRKLKIRLTKHEMEEEEALAMN